MLREYRYNLIRYVPDLERMEPFNVGVILQGGGRVAFRINTDVSHRKEVDAQEYRAWRRFFTHEIDSEGIPLFQPDRDSVEFLNYLSSLCAGPVLLSRPLHVQVDESTDFTAVLSNLYLRLVLPKGHVSRLEQTRPTGTFRERSSEKRFEARGMRKHSPVMVGQERLWTAYRQFNDPAALAMPEVAVDKVEVADRLGETSNEVERLQLIVPKIDSFLAKRVSDQQRQYVLLADRMISPFKGQPEDEFVLMQNDLETRVQQVIAAGGRVIRSVDEAAEFVAELDRLLPPVAGKR